MSQPDNQLNAVQRKLELRDAELKEAHHHIAALEEKLAKLKEYQRELKRLKEERQRLRKSVERRVGQVLLAPYQLPTDYPGYEILILKGDKCAVAPAAFSRFPQRLLNFSGMDNCSAAKNYAANQTDAPWLLFLDDRVEVIDPEWLTIMAEHVQQREVGAIGVRLVNPGGTVEHAGIVVGVNGTARAAFRGFPAEHPGANRQLQVTRNCSAVSSACMLTRSDVFEQVGGFDESLSGVFADVDLCLKMRRAGYRIVYTPFAKLYWHEQHPDKTESGSAMILRQRWQGVLDRDPYYNPNLSRERADFSLELSSE